MNALGIEGFPGSVLRVDRLEGRTGWRLTAVHSGAAVDVVFPASGLGYRIGGRVFDELGAVRAIVEGLRAPGGDPARPDLVDPWAVLPGAARLDAPATKGAWRAEAAGRRMTTVDRDPGFDAPAYAQRLEEAGVGNEQAQAHATRLRGRRLAARGNQAELATKIDLANLEARLRGEMAALKARLRGEMTALEARLRGEMTALEARLQAIFYRALCVQTAAFAGIVVAIVKFL